MTEQEAKNRLIAWAEAQIGTREGANNWNRYAKGMEKLYGWDVQNTAGTCRTSPGATSSSTRASSNASGSSSAWP